VTDVARAEMRPVLDLPQLSLPRNAWQGWAIRGVSLLLLLAVLFQLRTTSPAELQAALPDSPWFAPVLLGLYLALPVADWVIFRRLWGLPLAGLPVLLRKRISNELLLVYSGEAYFYLWARRRTNLTNAPFGTIKDVNILSALVGNFVALGLLLLAYPLMAHLAMGRFAGAAVASAGVMLAGSALILLFSRRLFTLSRRELVMVSVVHSVRLLCTTFLAALLWHLALPEAPIGLWFVLSSLRALVSRLPLVPNKEMLFATIAVFLIGNDQEVGALIAMTSTAMLGLHLLFGGVLAISGLFERDGPERGPAERTA
jgi:hypothetical protein